METKTNATLLLVKSFPMTPRPRSEAHPGWVDLITTKQNKTNYLLS
jgi:hypothetical protein